MPNPIMLTRKLLFNDDDCEYIPLYPINCGNISHVGYDEPDSRLQVFFKGADEVTLFEKVPPELYQQFIFSKQPQAFLKKHIEGQYQECAEVAFWRAAEVAFED